jgi:arginine deiminase
MQPTVNLVSTGSRNTGLYAESTSYRALGNMVFTRDQQITTTAGVVIGRMGSQQVQYPLPNLSIVQ